MVSQLKHVRELPQMIGCGDVAGILGVSRRTVWRLVSSHEIPEPLRFGRSVRWRVADIERWIEERASRQSVNRELRRGLR
jgi:excisionase family DNA binding protein